MSKLSDKLKQVFVYVNNKPGNITKEVNTEALEDLLTDIVLEIEHLKPSEEKPTLLQPKKENDLIN